MSSNSVASIATALTGNFAASGIYQTNASNATNNIVDVNKCSKCGSTELETVSKEEYNKIIENNETSNSNKESDADEIKKSKNCWI